MPSSRKELRSPKVRRRPEKRLNEDRPEEREAEPIMALTCKEWFWSCKDSKRFAFYTTTKTKGKHI